LQSTDGTGAASIPPALTSFVSCCLYKQNFGIMGRQYLQGCAWAHMHAQDIKIQSSLFNSTVHQ